MKKHFYGIFILFFSLLFIWSCKDNGDKETNSPPQVTDVTSASGYGQIFLAWRIPTTENFYYTKIEYTDPKTKETKTVIVSKYDVDEETGLCKTVISGYIDQDEHEFSLVSYNLSNIGSNAVTIKGVALEPAFNHVIGTVTAEPDYLGALVKWENETGVPLAVKLKHIKKDEEILDECDAGVSGSRRIGNSGDRIKLAIYFEDTNGNASEEKIFEVEPKPAVALNKGLWLIHSYSSTQPTEGNVNYFIDGNVQTYWHTRYHRPGTTAWDPAKYPHWIAVDLGIDCVATEVEVFPRQGSNEGSTKIRLSISADGEDWIDFEEQNFDSRLWNGQGQKYEVKHSISTIRYVKVTCLAGYADYTHLAEINVFGGIRE